MVGRASKTLDSIADAVRLISEVSLWEEVGNRLGMSPQDVRSQLNLIVDRRNKIAHEADSDPTFPGSLWPIDEALVDEAVDFIEQVVESIYYVL